jgi:hypothetical protein
MTIVIPTLGDSVRAALLGGRVGKDYTPAALLRSLGTYPVHFR